VIDSCARGGLDDRANTQAHLDRIAAYDKRGPLINSLITINALALEDADRLDAVLRTTGRPVGPLHGIPIVVKDNIDVVGLPMTAGFQGWKNYYPPQDAPLVKKLRAAGAIILAKASLSEFTLGISDNINSVLPGFSRNPYNTAYGTGGSSNRRCVGGELRRRRNWHRHITFFYRANAITSCSAGRQCMAGRQRHCNSTTVSGPAPSLPQEGGLVKSPRSETVDPRLSIIFLSPLPSSIITIQALRLSSIAHSQGQNAKGKPNRS
jgi:hypothetical protein